MTHSCVDPHSAPAPWWGASAARIEANARSREDGSERGTKAMQGINDHIGYDVEDGVFKEIEAKQLDALRAKLDARRLEAQREAEREAHWMRCPKCGGHMAEAQFENVIVDKCTECHSVNLNADEIELLVQYERDHASLWSKIFHHRHTPAQNRRAA
jgi:Zn-finger nucleic acid-binding protein